jgi:REP element-mobilizing transposase RayT
MTNKSGITPGHKKSPSRKSLRLAEYDYSTAGYYFVTICVHGKRCLLGEVIKDVVHLNGAGRMIASIWLDMPRRIGQVSLDSFVVMPNHIHGIVISEKGIALSRVIQAFKSISTNEYIRGVHQYGWEKFDSTFWQRSFYDHVIRNDKDLIRVQEYIVNNPVAWALDEENPDQKKPTLGRTQGPPLHQE